MDIKNGKQRTQATPFTRIELIRASTMIRQLAEEHKVSEDEIREDLIRAMNAGMENPDQVVQKHWKSFYFVGKEPTAEDFLAWVIRLSSFSAK
ncbi:MAG: hypothetical protein IJI45_08940 [Anaerolineaceae bacterium]|nr:hypothetical protein [Anaerolineaceae bacterium]